MPKLSLYTNMKDHIPELMKSYVVYQFNCPGCNDSYIGKTERNLRTRTEEHACSDEKVPFTAILRVAVVKAKMKIFSISIMIHLIKHYLYQLSPK